MMVVTALLAIVLGAVSMVSTASDKAFRTGAIEAQLESQVAIAIDHVTDELRIAGVDTIVPDPIPGVGASEIRYVQATGITNGEIDWTPLRSLRLEYEAGELDDGLDNNGNELADEGTLILIEDLGGGNERRRVLTRWVAEFAEGELENGLDDNGNGLVDESGFLVERVGETYVIRLTLERRSGDGFLMRRTARTSTKPRNRLGDE